MRKILFLLLILSGFVACKDDDEIGFDVPVEFRKPLEFRSIPGGAVMKYYLPDNDDVFGVRVRYTNAWGETLIKHGTYLVDTVLLSGFTEACKGATAQVSFFNRNMEETEPIEVTFNTEKSATVAVFDSLKVNSFWGGFNVTYSSPEIVSGMIHIFYIGTNPLTHEPDSILMSSMPIMEGGDTLNFTLKQALDSVDVIVRMDDYSGKRVKQRVVTGLPCLTMDTLTPGDFKFKFMGDIVENETYEIGLKYLLDGDFKGTRHHKQLLSGDRYKYATFVAGPYAFNKRFIIDLGKKMVPAAVRLYAFLNYRTSYPSNDDKHPFASTIWSGYYISRLPSKIKLYGTNENPETVDIRSCTRLFELNDNPSFYQGFRYSWAHESDQYTFATNDYSKATPEEVEKAEPVLLNMECNYSGESFQYLFFVIEDTYDSARWNGFEENPTEYVTFNELEVCVKAE